MRSFCWLRLWSVKERTRAGRSIPGRLDASKRIRAGAPPRLLGGHESRKLVSRGHGRELRAREPKCKWLVARDSGRGRERIAPKVLLPGEGG